MPIRPEEISTRAQFAATLTDLRETAGLTVRELARRIETPPATVGGWFSGRHVPSPTQLPLFRSLLAECGIAAADDVDRWLAALQRARGVSTRRLNGPAASHDAHPPSEPDGDEIPFERAAEVDDVLARLAAFARDPGPSAGLLAVIGPAGSGKSAMLRAGVAAAIAAGRLPGGSACAVITPGREPVAALHDVLEQQPGVLVIDQFEELFASPSAVRAKFLRRLADRDPRILVVIGMRADFYAAAATEPVLLPALQYAQVLVGPRRPEQPRCGVHS